MLTEDQKATVVSMYKAGETFKSIWMTTGINGNTAASFLRNHHPNLIRNSHEKRKTEIAKKSKEWAERWDVSLTTGQYMYESAKIRFENKKLTCKQENIPFQISFDELEFPTHCPMLGIKLDYLTDKYRSDAYPTFDRIDNTKGYIPGNVHVVSWKANRLKNNGSREELRKIVNYLDSIST